MWRPGSTCIASSPEPSRSRTASSSCADQGPRLRFRSPVRLHLEVTVWRGAIAESRHRLQAAVVDAAGRRVLETEAPDLVTTFRSSAKPFQLLPLVERGHADRFRFEEADLAVMAASHTGSAEHVARVRGILARLSLPELALACGYHEPLDPASLDLVRRNPGQRSPVYNNCSGKHAG